MPEHPPTEPGPEHRGDPAAPEPPPEPAPVVPAGEFGPIREMERIASLDVLRGFAILGILFVNIQFFAMPMMRAFIDPAVQSGPWSEKAAWAFVQVFCTYKFISLFSIMFGAGLVVQMLRAQARGRSFASMYLRRLGVLALIGACHAFLLWYGDILLVYAFIGLIVFFCRNLKPRTLLLLAGVFVAVSAVLSTSCLGLQMFGKHMQAMAAEQQADDADAGEPESQEPATDETAGEDDEPRSAFDCMMAANFQPMSDTWQECELRAYRDGPLADAMLFRAVTYAFIIPALVLGFGWRVLALFLLGAALMKLDFFRPSAAAWQRRCLVWGLAIGLPLELAGAGITIANDFEFSWPQIVVTMLHEIGSMGLCLAYLGGVCLLASSGAMAWLLRGLTAVGRMALTTYLGETIIATTLMYWWGLGWFGSVSHLQQLGLTVAIYVVLMLFAVLWMRLFAIGPVEWLWRSLSYMKPQPLLRR